MLSIETYRQYTTCTGMLTIYARDLHCWDSDTPDFVGGGQLLPEGVRPVDKAHRYRSYNNQYIKSLYWGTKLTDIVATTI